VGIEEKEIRIRSIQNFLPKKKRIEGRPRASRESRQEKKGTEMGKGEREKKLETRPLAKLTCLEERKFL